MPVPHHDGATYKRNRKQRKRRARNRTSWLDKGSANALNQPRSKKR